MEEKPLSFLVRLLTDASMEDIVGRVGAALGCNFTVSTDDQFEDRSVFEAELIGLWVTVSRSEESGQNLYQLVGYVHEDWNDPWAVRSLDISEYVIGVLRRNDLPDWYIPTKEARLKEAGIEPNQNSPD